MRKELVKYANVEVPRYTSYPTAAQFSDNIGEGEYRNWLGDISPRQPLSFYVHIPFCEQMCWYCGCHTTIINSYDRIARYAQTLNRELDLLGRAVPENGGISHMHFGGGTPSLLGDDDFIRLIGNVRTNFHFADNAEIAIEIDPRTLSKKKAKTLAECGFTRASLGIQDFDEIVQEKIHRQQSFEVVRQAVEWLRSAGIGKINFDIMYGLPDQTNQAIEKTIELSLKLQPDRFAVFGYAHVPWFKKHQQMIKDEDMPDTGGRFQQANAAADALVAAGYVEVGFDHYALPDDSMAIALKNGTLRRNFQGYTDDVADILIGIGASSIGELPQGYIQNAPSLDVYRDKVEAGELPIVRGVTISPDDILRRSAIEAVMTRLEIDLREHCNRHNVPENTLDAALEKIKPMQDDKLVNIDGHRVVVTQTGRRFLRNIAAAFDIYWKPSPARHSRAV
jgi:oxygen-independent coproporphyrinogen-3 oxidase